ncbi:MAG: hypothetical protein GY950_02195 [bacterium]|nr:hypothetical protein [bacterium]
MMDFLSIDEFNNAFCTAIRESGEEERFLTKWGLDSLDDVYGILSNNVQGGYHSHKQSMLSVPVKGSVLTIGPGMGFCGFLLSPLYDRVTVAEPDGENCPLLERIAAHFPLPGGKKASGVMTVLHAGISITEDAVKYWETKRMLMKKRNLKGSILNFDIKEAAELADVFRETVSRVYLHKVLSSFSIANSFENIISACRLFLEEGGVITWSEPEYIFTDILQVPEGGTLDDIVIPVFEKNGMKVEVNDYGVSNTGDNLEKPLVEKWTLINGWRK